MTHRNNQRDERRQAEYWKQRALEAEAQLKRTTSMDDFEAFANAHNICDTERTPSGGAFADFESELVYVGWRAHEKYLANR